MNDRLVITACYFRVSNTFTASIMHHCYDTSSLLQSLYTAMIGTLIKQISLYRLFYISILITGFYYWLSLVNKNELSDFVNT